MCTLQINSQVPARRGIVLECMLQQHAKRTGGKGKTDNATRNHLGDGKNNGTAKQHFCHESIRTTRLLLGVGKYKEYTGQHINSMCHGCIKATRLLLGVAKYKESKRTL